MLCPSESIARPHVLTLSADTDGGVTESARAYWGLLESFGSPDDSVERRVSDVCYNAGVRRTHHDRRLAVVGASREDLLSKLSAFLDGDLLSGVSFGKRIPRRPPRIAFVFPGQGSQWWGMARDLLEQEPAFSEAVERFESAMPSWVDWSLGAVLKAEGESSPLDRVDVVQPALCAVQVGLAAVFRAWGVEPSAVVGHSMGEVAAAAVAGALTLEDAARVICTRSRLVTQASGRGAMAVVDLGLSRSTEVLRGFEDRVSIAASNSASSTLISGDPEAVRAIVASLESRGVFCRLVNVDYASHSPHMDPLMAPLLEELSGLLPAKASVPLYSTVTGGVAEGPELDAGYWARNLREPVLFSRAIGSLLEEGFDTFIELSPHPILLPSIQQDLPIEGSARRGTLLPSLRRGESGPERMLDTLATLHCSGLSVDWRRLYPSPRAHVALPSYPWQRSHFRAEEALVQRPADATRNRFDWGAILSAARDQALRFPADIALSAREEVQDALEALTSAYIARAFRDLGLFTTANERHAPKAIPNEAGVSSSFQALLSLWLRRLERRGWLVAEEGEFVSPAPLPAQDVEALSRALREKLVDESYFTDYLERCGENLVKVLRGQTNPLDLLFPSGSLETAEGLFEKSSAAKYGNAICREVVRVAAANRPRGIRILEVGSGVGGATASLVPILPPDTTGYDLTEVTPFFLDRTAARFESYPFVRGRSLDLDQSPGDQGYESGFYDVVVAANALNATQNVGRALERVHSLLAPGGLLLLVETTRHQPWFEVSFGLLWYWDREEREQHPFFTRQQWGEALRASGFEIMGALPGDAEAALLGQHVILARSRAWRTASEEGPSDAPRAALPAPTPLTRPVSGSSWVRAVLSREPGESLELARQELRRVLFGRIDFSRVHKILDLGGGRDAIDLAEELPEMRVDGLADTLSDSLAGNQDARRRDLGERVRFFHRDPSSGALPDQYDVAVRLAPAESFDDETLLLPNVARHLLSGGLLIEAAIVRNAGIDSPAPGEEEWCDLLSRSGLRLIEVIDGSREVGSFLEDSDFESHLEEANRERALGEESLRKLRALNRLGSALRRSELRYCWLVAQRDLYFRQDDLRRLDLERFRAPVSYRDRLAGSAVEEGAFYELAWVPDGSPEPEAHPLERTQASGQWLIFADRQGFGSALGRSLSARGESVVTVQPGSSYQRLADRSYRVRPGRRDDLDLLLEEVRGDSAAPLRGAVHLWSLDAAPADEATLASLDHVQSLAGLTLVSWVQAVAGRQWKNGAPRLWVVTGPIQPIAGAETNVAVPQSPVWGLGRVIAQEQSGLWGGLVALDSVSPEAAAERMCSRIVSSGNEDQVAIRPEATYVARLKRLGTSDGDEGLPSLRPDASYLITGGLGDLGLCVAGWLVQRGARRVVLMGRTKLPPRSSWSEIDEASRLREQVRAIQDMENQGAIVETLAADVSDAPKMRAFLEDRGRRGESPIRGVVHAAGFLGLRTLEDLDAAAWNATMKSKVAGAWVLHELFRQQPLDFFVLFSSAASMGFLGQGLAHYAAANAFLDALAHYRRSLGLPALSIDWGPWAHLGMAARNDLVERLGLFGIGGIAPEQGLRYLGALMSGGRTQAAVLEVDWDRLSRFGSMTRSALLSGLARRSVVDPRPSSSEEGLSAETILAAPCGQRQELLESALRARIAKVLRLSPSRIDVHQPLTRMGMDSLMGVELKNSIESELRVAVPLIELMRNGTVSHLAALLLGSLTGGPGPALSEEPPPSAPSENENDSMLLSLLSLGEGDIE
jgi:malonyl CoA-acyl carrier protein transacylase/SAM-dependent methyltransferase